MRAKYSRKPPFFKTTRPTPTPRNVVIFPKTRQWKTGKSANTGSGKIYFLPWITLQADLAYFIFPGLVGTFGLDLVIFGLFWFLFDINLLVFDFVSVFSNFGLADFCILCMVLFRSIFVLIWYSCSVSSTLVFVWFCFDCLIFGICIHCLFSWFFVSWFFSFWYFSQILFVLD